jgi:hypothetical protein
MNKLALCLILLSATASADELQFDLTGQTTAGPVDVSFVLDTASGNQSFDYAPSGYLQTYGGWDVTATNVLMSVNGQVIYSGNGMAGMGGSTNAAQNPLMSSLNVGPLSWDTFYPPTVMQGSSDPLTQIYMGLNGSSGGSVILTTDSGLLEYFAFSDVSVTDLSVKPQLFAASFAAVSVPEPSPLVLFVLGLAILLLRGGRPEHSSVAR